MQGNTPSMHWFQRRSVIEENHLPYNRFVSLELLIVGLCFVLLGGFSLLSEILKTDLYAIMGSVLLILGTVAGLLLYFHAKKKYKKGPF